MKAELALAGAGVIIAGIALFTQVAASKRKNGGATPIGPLPTPPLTTTPPTPSGQPPPVINQMPPVGLPGGLITTPGMPGIAQPASPPGGTLDFCSEANKNAIVKIFEQCTFTSPQFCDVNALRIAAKDLAKCGWGSDAAYLNTLADYAEKWIKA